MTISEKSPPVEVSSTVVDVDTSSIDALTVDGLVDRNYASVYRYAFRLSGCAAAAEDITQDVFVKAISHLHQLRQTSAERAWIMSITRREFMRWLREVANPAHGRPTPLDCESLSVDDRRAEQLDNGDWVQSALILLGEDARIVLLMYYFEELSYAEIAQQLQIPIGTVMSRLSRGRENLRQSLDRTNRQSHSSNSGTPTRLAAVLETLQPQALDANDALAQPTVTPGAREAKHG